MASPPLRRKTPRLDSDDDATHSSRPASSSSSPDQPMRRRRRRRPHIDLAHFPVAELIGPLAHLLQQITAANDAHNAARRSHTSHRASSEASGSGGHTPMIVPPSTPAGDLASGTSYPFPPAGHFSATTSPALTRSGSLASMAMPAPLASLDPDEAGEDMFSASRTAIENPSSTLAYHARNVPTISIEAYLTRILKCASRPRPVPLTPADCPTTCEVFISLLVFFDRMARTSRPVILDSYNVHRLIIAGVAVSSKLFSDVFYTNQRYSKVGGLPVAELNQLELQFLLLNDFRLLVPVEELQRYADQLAIWAGLVEDDPLEEDEDPADAQGLSVRGDRRPASGSSHASATSTATVRAYASGRDPDADAVAMDEDG